MKARYSSKAGLISFDIGEDFGASLVPVSGKVVSANRIEITYQNNGFSVPRKMSRTYHLLPK